MNRFFHPTIFLALALLAVITMMILPMPAFVLDLGLTVSFGLAILVFTNTLFISRPLDFSAFPTVLLASLMLRLSLNISSTKLIIGEGHNGPSAAGEVIEGFAMFVMGGSVYLGVVVFGVLMIVNFIVITKGAGRMAEVGARFALDGMPGRQLAIDSDMAAGAITHEEARERRKTEQEETTFFGSLDGASKFVKGDAIAGLLITLLNIVMGLAIGVIGHDMPIGEAFETYAILTVGDGLVSQIPAVIISIAAALLLSKGGAHGSADKALIGQLGGFPAALATVACLLALLALVPGLPMAPFLLGAVILGVAAWFSHRRAETLAIEAPKTDEEMRAVCQRVNGPCLFNLVLRGKTPPVTMDGLKALGFAVTILPDLIWREMVMRAESVLEDLTRGTLPSQTKGLLVSELFERVGSKDWDPLRTAFQEPARAAE